MQIRVPTKAEAADIATVHVSAWQSAYEGMLPKDLLNNLSVERRSQGWLRVLQSAPESLLVAEKNGRILGFINFGSTRDEDLNPQQTAEIYAIYLMPEAWGKGIGYALYQAAVGRLVIKEFTAVSLWVLHNNHRAIHFYERVGFQADGSEKIERLGDIDLIEKRYVNLLEQHA